MKFDVIIGNPPYKGNIYESFIQISLSAKICSCWITPADWFVDSKLKSRILPRIAALKFYQCEGEVFPINLLSGISIFTIAASPQSHFELINSSAYFAAFSNHDSHSPKDIPTLNILGNSIIANLGSYKPLDLLPPDLISSGYNKYLCYINPRSYTLGGSSNRYRGCFYYDNKFKAGHIIHDITIHTEPCLSGTKSLIFSSNSEFKCRSFISYLETRIIRFLIAISATSYSNMLNSQALRFVPQQDFNYIFEDVAPLDCHCNPDGTYIDSDNIQHCVLSVRYNITPEQMALINSVILL